MTFITIAGSQVIFLMAAHYPVGTGVVSRSGDRLWIIEAERACHNDGDIPSKVKLWRCFACPSASPEESAKMLGHEIHSFGIDDGVFVMGPMTDRDVTLGRLVMDDDQPVFQTPGRILAS